MNALLPIHEEPIPKTSTFMSKVSPREIKQIPKYVNLNLMFYFDVFLFQIHLTFVKNIAPSLIILALWALLHHLSVAMSTSTRLTGTSSRTMIISIVCLLRAYQKTGVEPNSQDTCKEHYQTSTTESSKEKPASMVTETVVITVWIYMSVTVTCFMSTNWKEWTFPGNQDTALKATPMVIS